jgi:hypothetical protein
MRKRRRNPFLIQDAIRHGFQYQSIPRMFRQFRRRLGAEDGEIELVAKGVEAV